MYGENIKVTESAGGVLPAAMGFARGVIAAAVFTVVSFALFACLLAYTGLAESSVPVIAVAVEGVGAFLSGFCAARGAGSRGFLTGMLAGVLYMAIIWVISVLSGSGFSLGSHLLTMLGVSVGCGGLGGIFGVNVKTGKTNKRKR